jgi:hypothetical protein
MNNASIDRVNRAFQNCFKRGILMCVSENFAVDGNNVLKLHVVIREELIEVQGLQNYLAKPYRTGIAERQRALFHGTFSMHALLSND